MASYFSIASSALNPKLLARKMYLQQWYSHIFGQFVGPEFVKNTGQNVTTPIVPVGPSFTGAPIEKFEEFVAQGRTDMDIPVRKRLTGRPKYGDDKVEGSGEKTNVSYRSVPINYTRKAWQPPTGMSEQIARPYADQIITNANAQLTDWLNNHWPGELMMAVLGGGSVDILNPTALFGRAKATVSHPNFYTGNGGAVSYSGGKPGTTGYESSVQAALDGLSNVSACKMRVGLLKNLVTVANRLRIQPIVVKGGYKFFAVFISDSQWVQLQQDPDYIDITKRGQNTPLTDNPLINAAQFHMAGICVYVDQSLFGARTSAGGDTSVVTPVEYGPSPTASERAQGNIIGNWMTTPDTNTYKCGILMGQSALSMGVGARLKFTEESHDHGFFREFAISYIQSVVRADIYDKDGMSGTAGDFDYNDSSLVFATYSPYTLAWN